MSDPEQRIYDPLEVAEQQQKSITDQLTALGTSRDQLTTLMENIRADASAAATQSVQATVAREVAPIIVQLKASAVEARKHWRFASWRQTVKVVLSALLGGIAGGFASQWVVHLGESRAVAVPAPTVTPTPAHPSAKHKHPSG